MFYAVAWLLTLYSDLERRQQVEVLPTKASTGIDARKEAGGPLRVVRSLYFVLLTV